MIIVSSVMGMHVFFKAHADMSGYKFQKRERLRYRSLVDDLFEEGEHIHAFPLRLTYLWLEDDMLEDEFRSGVPDGIGPLQVMITVPKKKLRRAVDRVAMRRRIRESWRLQRLPLKAILESADNSGTLCVGIVYLANKRVDYKKISEKMSILLAELEKRMPNILTSNL